MIPLENHVNHENPSIRNENNCKIMKIIKLNMRIMKIMKIKELHAMSMKVMKQKHFT